jgi:hypothetical protein
MSFHRGSTFSSSEIEAQRERRSRDVSRLSSSRKAKSANEGAVGRFGRSLVASEPMDFPFATSGGKLKTSRSRIS